MGREGIAQEFWELGFKASTIAVFFCLREVARSNEDGRVVAGREWLADNLNLTEKVVRNALKELQREGFISIAPQKGKRVAAMVSFPSHRREGQLKGQQKGQLNYATNQIDLNSEGQLKGQQKGHTGVTAVRRSSGVDVDDVGLEKELGKPRATPFVDKSRPTATARYEAAVARAPDLPHVTMHIDRIYADLSGGHKYPWAGNAAAATVLADLIFSHGAPLVIAAAERYFVRGHAWTEERAWAIDEFAKQFAKLIAIEGATKRAAQVTIELQNQSRPSTPKELRAQLAAMRRRELDAIIDYKPEDVHMLDDLRRLRAKEPVVV